MKKSPVKFFDRTSKVSAVDVKSAGPKADLISMIYFLSTLILFSSAYALDKSASREHLNRFWPASSPRPLEIENGEFSASIEKDTRSGSVGLVFRGPAAARVSQTVERPNPSTSIFAWKQGSQKNPQAVAIEKCDANSTSTCLATYTDDGKKKKFVMTQFPTGFYDLPAPSRVSCDVSPGAESGRIISRALKFFDLSNCVQLSTEICKKWEDKRSTQKKISDAALIQQCKSLDLELSGAESFAQTEMRPDVKQAAQAKKSLQLVRPDREGFDLTRQNAGVVRGFETPKGFEARLQALAQIDKQCQEVSRGFDLKTYLGERKVVVTPVGLPGGGAAITPAQQNSQQ